MKHGKKKSKYKWVPWALGIGTAGVVAYILLKPKTASAGQLPASPPGPGNIQITAGSKVPLIAPLKAKIGGGIVATGGDYKIVPAGTTITVDQLDADGTIHFQYGGLALSSPVEDYSLVVGG